MDASNLLGSPWLVAGECCPPWLALCYFGLSGLPLEICALCCVLCCVWLCYLPGSVFLGVAPVYLHLAGLATVIEV
jgi:hypothetical protein